jgi:GTP pyrophosphokinase
VELFTGWHDWTSAEPQVRAALPEQTADVVCAAVAFAADWHGTQKRPTGAPYLDHLLEALEILIRGAEVHDSGILCAAVLHDVLEDTPCPVGEIGKRFGPHVADLVTWVTKPSGGDKETYLRRLRDAPREAILVKLADRASNVQTLRNLPPAKAASYYRQTVAYIVPLAAIDPWFQRWYAEWAIDFADLTTG